MPKCQLINKFSLTSQKKITDIDDEALECLITYAWPGNIRELENAIEYSFARSTANLIHLSKLPPNIKKQRGAFGRVQSPVNGDTQKSELLRLLEQYQWNKSVVAKKMGMRELPFGAK